MTVRREIARSRVAREAYLVSRKQGYPIRKRTFRSALHASRDTSDEERSSESAIAAEVVMNHAGQGDEHELAQLAA